MHHGVTRQLRYRARNISITAQRILLFADAAVDNLGSPRAGSRSHEEIISKLPPAIFHETTVIETRSPARGYVRTENVAHKQDDATGSARKARKRVLQREKKEQVTPFATGRGQEEQIALPSLVKTMSSGEQRRRASSGSEGRAEGNER